MIFTGLPALNVPQAALEDLARAMIEVPTASGDNATIPAGFTYFGQFVDHDVTLDLTPLGGPSPIGQPNARNPRFDLDSVYGEGPTGSPELYESGGQRFRIGTTTGTAFPNDLPRNGPTAIIGDSRNDENLVVAQLHLQFLKLHNKLISQGMDFDTARHTVRLHYQFIVLTEFLPKICGQAVVDDVVQNGRQFYRPNTAAPFMPLEFSAAAYRFGHSMVRETYNYNQVFPNATLAQFFTFTGIAAAPIPHVWMADWRRFFAIDTAVPPNPTRAIDPFLAPALANLPHFPAGQNALALRNLIRGNSVGLPSGQGVASVIGAQQLSQADIASGPDGAVAQQHGLHSRTPLWYYILKESGVREGGRRLGAVGARICAEVMVGLIEMTPKSILNTTPRPVPTLPQATPGKFTMADLLRFVGEISPLDGI